jgi:hypothetical protein
MKPSLTGYLTMESESERFENNMFSNLGSARYSPSSGFNWDEINMQIKSSSINISPESLSAWLVTQAAFKGIVITESQLSTVDFKTKISYQIAGSDKQNTAYGDLINGMG